MILNYSERRFDILYTHRIYLAVKYDVWSLHAFVIISQHWFMHQQSARAALSERLRLRLNSFQNKLKLLKTAFFLPLLLYKQRSLTRPLQGKRSSRCDTDHRSRGAFNTLL